MADKKELHIEFSEDFNKAFYLALRKLDHTPGMGLEDYFREGICEGIINLKKYVTPETYQALTTLKPDDSRIVLVRNELLETMVKRFLDTYMPNQLEGEIDPMISIANRLASAEMQPVITPVIQLSEGSIADDPISHPGYIDPHVWDKHEQQDPLK